MTEESKFPVGTEPEGSEGVASVDVEEGDSSATAIPDDAFFSPDGPIARPEGDIPREAIFSPDDAIGLTDDGEGVVRGMGGEGAGDSGRGMGLDWEIRNTSRIMETLAKDLREQGMEALRVHPDTAPMDAMLRSFVAGFLVGKRGSED